MRASHDLLSGLNREQPKPYAAQIGEFVRELILTGHLAPGEKLPPTQELARLWKTHAPTVQAALAPLMKQGLIERRPGIGTHVRRRGEKLTCMGLYYMYDVWSRPETAFGRSVHQCLQEQCVAAGVRTQLFLDPRRLANQGEPWVQLVQAIERHEIQGLIAVGADWPHLHWLERLPVASAYLTTGNLPNTVSFDFGQFVDLGLRYLRQQGCQSAGLIAAGSPKEIHPDGSRHPRMEMFARFVDTARDLGLEIRNEWVGASPDPKTAVQVGQEFGYQRFQALWRQRKRPQGLLVMPDSIAPGVIMGLLENRVAVPRELRLVFQKNDQLEMFCPMPAAFAVASDRAVAQALLAQIQKQLRGESCEPIILSHRLVLSPAGNKRVNQPTTGR